MRRFYFLLGTLLFFSVSHSQFDTAFARTGIRRCADSLTQGFKTKDWELFARYSCPALVGLRGGTKEFIRYLNSSFSPVPVSAWKLYEPGKILQVIKTGRDLQAVVELKSVLEWQGIRITTVSCLLGESWDGGLFWTFFDSEGGRAAALQIKPDLDPQLIIPLKKEETEPVSSLPKTKNGP